MAADFPRPNAENKGPPLASTCDANSGQGEAAATPQQHQGERGNTHTRTYDPCGAGEGRRMPSWAPMSTTHEERRPTIAAPQWRWPAQSSTTLTRD